eukprot:UN23736
MLLKALQNSQEENTESMDTDNSNNTDLKQKNTKKNSFRWYNRVLHKVIDRCDVIVEILDARFPESCRSKAIERKIQSMKSTTTLENKKIILLLNKIDLVPSDVLTNWLKVLRREFPVIAFKSNVQNQNTHLSQTKIKFNSESRNNTAKSVGVDALMSILKNYCRSLNIKTVLSVGFVGYPNVGKSSVINSLKRLKKCSTSSTPGHTKELQEIKLDANIRLVDCPGVLMNDTDNTSSLLLKNAIKVETVDNLMDA